MQLVEKLDKVKLDLIEEREISKNYATEVADLNG
jgi:hypothetical protein